MLKTELWSLLKRKESIALLSSSLFIYIIIIFNIINPTFITLEEEDKYFFFTFLELFYKLYQSLFIQTAILILIASMTFYKQKKNGQIWYYKTRNKKTIFNTKLVSIFILFLFTQIIVILNLTISFILYFSKVYENMIFSIELNSQNSIALLSLVSLIYREIIASLLGVSIAIRHNAIIGIIGSIIYMLLNKVSSSIPILKYLFTENYVGQKTENFSFAFLEISALLLISLLFIYIYAFYEFKKN